MTKLIGFVLLVAFVAAGCSKPGITVTDSQGNKVTASPDGTKVTSTDANGKTTTVETNTNGGNVTVKGSDGKTSYEGGISLTEADLGLPFYAGSTEKTGASMKVDEADKHSRLSTRTTTDDPAKVIEFYKTKIKDPKTMSMGSGDSNIQMVTGKLDDGTEVSVTAAKEKGQNETTIQVTTSKKTSK